MLVTGRRSRLSRLTKPTALVAQALCGLAAGSLLVLAAVSSAHELAGPPSAAYSSFDLATDRTLAVALGASALAFLGFLTWTVLAVEAVAVTRRRLQFRGWQVALGFLLPILQLVRPYHVLTVLDGALDLDDDDAADERSYAERMRERGFREPVQVPAPPLAIASPNLLRWWGLVILAVVVMPTVGTFVLGSVAFGSMQGDLAQITTEPVPGWVPYVSAATYLAFDLTAATAALSTLHVTRRVEARLELWLAQAP